MSSSTLILPAISLWVLRGVNWDFDPDTCLCKKVVCKPIKTWVYCCTKQTLSEPFPVPCSVSKLAIGLPFAFKVTKPTKQTKAEKTLKHLYALSWRRPSVKVAWRLILKDDEGPAMWKHFKQKRELGQKPKVEKSQMVSKHREKNSMIEKERRRVQDRQRPEIQPFLVMGNGEVCFKCNQISTVKCLSPNLGEKWNWISL